MSQQQIDFIQNMFNDPQRGIEWVNNTFNRLKDPSGTIPRATFGHKIKEIAMSLGAPEPDPLSLQEAINAADPDGDGRITYDEFKNFCVQAGDGLLHLLGL
jgi:Ca2+-binding EF-hand superfamily protein